LTSLFIIQPEDHRPVWYIHTITGDIIDPCGTYIQSQVNTGINIGIIYN